MKRSIYYSLLMLCLSTFLFIGCKKEKQDDPLVNDLAAERVNAADESEVQGEVDQAADDANAAINNFGHMSGRYAAGGPVCGATVVPDSAQKMVMITFDDSTACNGKKRSGTIKVQLTGALKWKDQDALITITFINYKVTRLSDNKSLTLNGSKSVKNLSGGLVWKDTSVVHRIRAVDLLLTFDDGTTRKWSLARKITFHRAGMARHIKVEGDTTIGGTMGTVMWGTTRHNHTFINSLSTPIRATHFCGWHRPIDGVREHSGGKSFKTTFGLDANGNKVSGNCATHFKIEMNTPNGPMSKLLPYK
jgi:hypothetical protein